ncbi:AcvB/VirJ family lysyl-phosphatidylglycerol hydrolase [Williamwhitmania taraxaci]|uniref:Type IV secretory pathway, VirJ component n=1 Tax=Williamwhitmania taraxaci TaxID=1640674 RepID=A0A1G6QLI6_9BACT|nr:AcvB/VirJ family lysyl-phosphatidylglycerol hydrolase [Williamwhitmania taraxaci]SDC93272.1 Type IV secretory pathway, VirJ component [Williamwhitmania taraxaci]
MNKIFLTVAFIFVGFNGFSASQPETVAFGSFGKVRIYRPEGTPSSVVIFVSGDGGWNDGVVDMAKHIVKQGAIVAGIDIKRYLKGLAAHSSKCYYPSGDVEQLSMMVQKKYKLKQYYKPILVGYSAGATMVYGMLAQAPANTFKGAIVFGFSPDLDINKPLCAGSGLQQHPLTEGKTYLLEASATLSAPFILFHGSKDKICPYSIAHRFMKDIPSGQLIELPQVGHDFSVTESWVPQFVEVFGKVVHAPSFAEQKNSQNALLQSQHLTPLPADLPLTLIPTAKKDSLPMVFLISGDGGWTSFDHSLGEAFAEKGMPVVGLDAQKYFWNAKTPEEATLELSKAIRHYMEQWRCKQFILAGYSFGACVVPFIANRLPLNMKQQMEGVYCFSPSETADFEIHISDMLDLSSSDNSYSVVEETKKLNGLHPVCFFGSEEEPDVRHPFEVAGAKVITLPGNHHYNNNTARLADEVVKAIIALGRR